MIICDLQLEKIYQISPEIVELLEECKNISVEDLTKNEEYANVSILFDQFIELGIGFYTDDLNNWPDLSLEWKSSELINNSIIEIDNNKIEVILSFLNEINGLGCKHLEIRSYSSLDFKKIDEILKKCIDSRLRSITLYINYYSIKNFNKLDKLSIQNKRLLKIIVHSVPENKINEIKKGDNVRINYFLTTQILKNNNHCGNVNINDFKVNINLFTESMVYNNCLNKKISLCDDGIVKNCPSMSEVLQKFKVNNKLNILKITNTPHSKINKDLINVCKDCEFRYVCNDCRAYTDNNKIHNSRPSKCTYNPYIAKWDGEQGFKTLEQCGVVSNENGFSIDHDEIAKINEELWGEKV